MSARKREVRARNKARRAALANPQDCPTATTWIVHGAHWWGPEPQAWCPGLRRVPTGRVS